MISYKSRVPLAGQVGHSRSSQSETLKPCSNLCRTRVYLIARIVVFKDSPLASARPDWP
jgi:hypothetical protein